MVEITKQNKKETITLKKLLFLLRTVHGVFELPYAKEVLAPWLYFLSRLVFSISWLPAMRARVLREKKF